ncbi:MAG: putative Ig domain-containing protein [Bryobacterales bacterium]|nr:putative Ig domain-containing protein [Bryobacterales bacterium]
MNSATGLEGTPEFAQLSVPGVAPSPRGGVVAEPASALTAERQLIVFAGGTPNGLVNDAWVLSTSVPLSITSPPTLPSGVAGLAYSQTLAAAGGVPPYQSWTVVGGSVPLGLVLDPATGVISGTPTLAGTSSFSVRVTDSSSPAQSATQTFTITVNPPLMVVIASLPGGTVGAPYSAQLNASGGTPPYVWSRSGGALPPGLVLDPGTGAITGVPTVAGANSFTVRVTDSGSPAQSATRAFSITVAAVLTITTTSLPGGTVGVPYSTLLTASGGTPPFTWSRSGGSLPPGLALDPSTGAITGTPTVPGSSSLTVRVTDSGSPSQSATQALSITINPALAVTATPLPNGTVGMAYSAQLNATGGVAPYSGWAVSGGSLPPGLTLNAASGLISGVPGRATGSPFGFSVTVRDSAGNTSPAQALSISVAAGVTVAITLLPNGTVGAAYSAQLNATGGLPPYSNWTVSGGSLPPGLTLNAASGLISGVPGTVTGSPFSFSVTVQDSAGSTSPAQPLSISIASGVTVATTSLPNGTVGVVYSAQLNATGGAPPYGSWVVSAGALPPGLTLDAAGGLISGVPGTATGSPFSFTVTVRDSAGNTSPAQALSISIAAGVAVTTTSLPNGTVGLAYSAQLTATGGAPPYGSWAVSGGALPPGLTLNSASGLISGVPGTATGSPFSFSVAVRDSADNTSPAQALSISVTPGVTVATTSLPNGAAGIAYSAQLNATGGKPPYGSWTLSGGALPPGLTLNAASGLISGVPSNATGSPFSFSVTVRDSTGNASPAQALSISVAAGVIVATTALPSGTVGMAYSVSLNATGGAPPYGGWALSAGALPPGLMLNATSGLISGVPSTATGSPFSFSVTVRDSAGTTSPAQTLSISVAAGVVVTTTALINGTVGAAYSIQLSATGGTPPYGNWAVSAGALPPGLMLNATSGLISGVPSTATGSPFSFSVTVRDSAGNVSPPQALSISVAAGVTVTATSLPSGAVGVAYWAQLTATGGAPPYGSWTVSGGGLPNGLALNPTTGLIAGIPTAGGTFSFAVTVRDSGAGSSPPQPLSITIAPGVVPSFSLSVSQQPAAITDQPGLTLHLTEPYPSALEVQFALSFTPAAAGLPGANYISPALQFATGGTAASVTVPANSASWPMPPLQIGDVAGTAVVVLTAVRVAGTGETLQLPASRPSTSITVPRLAPVIVPGSVRIANVTTSGLTVQLVAASTPRDLMSAVVTFAAASGTQLVGTSFTIPIGETARAWFESSDGQKAGGAFELKIPFPFSGDPKAIGSVTVTLTNSIGSSASVTGMM